MLTADAIRQIVKEELEFHTSRVLAAIEEQKREILEALAATLSKTATLTLERIAQMIAASKDDTVKQILGHLAEVTRKIDEGIGVAKESGDEDATVELQKELSKIVDLLETIKDGTVIINKNVLAGREEVKTVNENVLAGREEVKTVNENVLETMKGVETTNKNVLAGREEVKTVNENVLETMKGVETTNKNVINTMKAVEDTNYNVLAGRREVRPGLKVLLDDSAALKKRIQEIERKVGLIIDKTATLSSIDAKVSSLHRRGYGIH